MYLPFIRQLPLNLQFSPNSVFQIDTCPRPITFHEDLKVSQDFPSILCLLSVYFSWRTDKFFRWHSKHWSQSQLTHWGRVTHICVGKLIIIGPDNGLSPDRRQAIIWTNVGLMSFGPLRTYFSENLIKIQQFSLKKLHVKMSSAKWRPSCLDLNVLSNPE